MSWLQDALIGAISLLVGASPRGGRPQSHTTSLMWQQIQQRRQQVLDSLFAKRQAELAASPREPSSVSLHPLCMLHSPRRNGQFRSRFQWISCPEMADPIRPLHMLLVSKQW